MRWGEMRWEMSVWRFEGGRGGERGRRILEVFDTSLCVCLCVFTCLCVCQRILIYQVAIDYLFLKLILSILRFIIECYLSILFISLDLAMLREIISSSYNWHVCVRVCVAVIITLLYLVNWWLCLCVCLFCSCVCVCLCRNGANRTGLFFVAVFGGFWYLPCRWVSSWTNSWASTMTMVTVARVGIEEWHWQWHRARRWWQSRNAMGHRGPMTSGISFDERYSTILRYDTMPLMCAQRQRYRLIQMATSTRANKFIHQNINNV